MKTAMRRGKRRYGNKHIAWRRHYAWGRHGNFYREWCAS